MKTIPSKVRGEAKAAANDWGAPAGYSAWLDRVRRTRLFADVRRVLDLAEQLAAEARRVADELDDCDPPAHPFWDGQAGEPNWQQDDLRTMASVVSMCAGGVDSAFVGVTPLAAPTPLPASVIS